MTETAHDPLSKIRETLASEQNWILLLSIMQYVP